MLPSKQTVIVTARVVGFHFWAAAPDEVSYLRANHRHEFHLRVEANVTDGDREVEFHILKRLVREATGGGELEIEYGPMSCEHIAVQLATKLKELGTTVSAIEVFEDGECGARVEF